MPKIYILFTQWPSQILGVQMRALRTRFTGLYITGILQNLIPDKTANNLIARTGATLLGGQ